MFKSPISKLSLTLSILFSLLIVILISLSSSLSSETTVVFCDVGQGDGAYIRINNRIDLVIDAGPGRKILDCLGKYMPFYDRSIELAIISHPQKDHFGGFLYILDRYDIKKFWMNQVYNSSRSFAELLEKIDAKRIVLEFPKAGEKFTITEAEVEVFWPSEDFLAENTFVEAKTHKFFRQTGVDLNDFSLVFSVDVSGIKMLFTGDASAFVLNKLLNQSKIKSNIMKVPHHGSKNGLTVESLKLANPTYGVISVGKNNSYGHPSEDILYMLEAQSVKTRRTDIEGDIIFKIPNPNFQ
ncbi:MBL fold metallo-hydrolase [Candidatus Roizmanbacteria bacterium]|nr:MBL fold metallo-hydrolase [Candidatus Roizmanbacteria bacterium]